MRTEIIDPNTQQPFKSRKEFELWRDLEHFMNTGRHRRPAKIRWIRKTQAA
jgi:hypothetical protein